MNSTEFVNLFNSTYSRKIDSSYYSWRFGRRDSNSRIFFTHDEQGLKGCVGLHLLNMGGFQAALVVDAMTDERCRDDGRTFAFLRAKIEQCARANDVKALFMLPNQRGLEAWSADEKWNILGEITTFTRDTCSHPGYPRSNRIVAIQSERFGVWVNTIAASFQNVHPELTSVQRRKPYLNWRTDNPLHGYTILRIYQPEEHMPFGYLTLKTFTHPETKEMIGDIVDILWAEDDPDTLMDMLYTALDYFHRQGVSKATIWLQTNTILDAVGYHLRFTPTEQQRHFCVKILDPDYVRFTDPMRWYLTMIDSEIY